MGQLLEGFTVLTFASVLTMDSDTFRVWSTANSVALEDTVSLSPLADETVAVGVELVSALGLAPHCMVEVTPTPPTTIRMITANEMVVDPMPILGALFIISTWYDPRGV
jgi:hypothetical protein